MDKPRDFPRFISFLCVTISILHHYLFPEEIYDYLKQSSYFQEYTEEQLQQDLKQLNSIDAPELQAVKDVVFQKKKSAYQGDLVPLLVEDIRGILDKK